MKKIIIFGPGVDRRTLCLRAAKRQDRLHEHHRLPSRGTISNMIVTRTDSLQKIIDLKIKFRVSVAEKKFLAEQDSILLQLVKPYYDKGWKLVSFATDGSNFDNNSTAYRYYLAKDQQ